MIHSLKGVVVGQQLWFVPKHLRPGDSGERPRFVAVTKVGRKWIQLSEFNRRAEIATGDVFESGNARWHLGCCYVDRNAWQAEADLTNAWRDFQKQVDRTQSLPPLVTMEWLIEARQIIGTK